MPKQRSTIQEALGSSSQEEHPHASNNYKMVSPWLVGLLPWVIDLLFKTGFLTTVSGALIWGLVIVVFFTQEKLKDMRLKQLLNRVLLILCVLWTGAWFQRLLTPHEPANEPTKALYFLHATFLMAATGALVVVLWSALLGLSKQKNLAQSSQQKNSSTSQKNFSLEALLKLSSWSLELAKNFWVLGLLLSILALSVKIVNLKSSWSTEFISWLSYPTVWAVWGVAIALQIANSSVARAKMQTRYFFRNCLILSIACLVIVSFVLLTSSTGTAHFAKEFLR